MAELVDAADLKSAGGNIVPVQVRPAVPDLQTVDLERGESNVLRETE